jgi:hypothetical protein
LFSCCIVVNSKKRCIRIEGNICVVVLCCGIVALWRCGVVALWRCAVVLLWRCVLWRCGVVAFTEQPAVYMFYLLL